MTVSVPQNHNTVTLEIIGGLPRPESVGLTNGINGTIHDILAPINPANRLSVLLGLSPEEIYDVCFSDQVNRMDIDDIPDTCPVKTVKQFGIFVIARKLCPKKSKIFLGKGIIDYALFENLAFSIIEAFFQSSTDDRIRDFFYGSTSDKIRAFFEFNTADRIKAFFWAVDKQKMQAFFQSSTADRIKAFFRGSTSDQIGEFFRGSTSDQIKAFFEFNHVDNIMAFFQGSTSDQIGEFFRDRTASQIKEFFRGSTSEEIAASWDDPKVSPRNLFA